MEDIKEAVIEVRYDQSLLFDDVNTINGIKKRLKDDLPHYQKDEKNDARIFVNPPKKIFAAILSNRSSVIAHDVMSIDNFKRKANDYLIQIAEALEVDEYQRIGFRQHFGVKVSNQNEANIKIRNLFVKDMDKLVNPKVQFSLDKGDYKLNIFIHPASDLSITVQDNEQTSEQAHYVVIDIHVYTNKLTKRHGLSAFIKNANVIAINKKDELKSIMFG